MLVEGAERAQRRQVIVNAAHELAEAKEAVTTRRLADRIEYSQPVLYSHFEGKDAFASAVASRGLGSWPRYCTSISAEVHHIQLTPNDLRLDDTSGPPRPLDTPSNAEKV